MWYIVMSVSQGEPKYLFLPCTLTSILYSPLLSSITMLCHHSHHHLCHQSSSLLSCAHHANITYFFSHDFLVSFGHWGWASGLSGGVAHPLVPQHAPDQSYHLIYYYYLFTIP